MYNGTYGKYNNLPGLPYRTDKGGGKADFVTVGKIDNGRAGVFQETRKFGYAEILRQWSRLSDNEKKDCLIDIFEEEKKALPALINDWVANHGEKPAVFEIANEPNLFPYIPPEMYAWYYNMWRNEIKAQARLISAPVVILNGGLWCNSCLPSNIVKMLPLIGVKVTDEHQYLKTFLEYIGPSAYPDVLNLHIYPFVDDVADTEKAVYKIKALIDVGSETYFEQLPIWITEWGNINALNTTKTLSFIRKLYRVLVEDHANIKRMYFFQVRPSDSRFGVLHALNDAYRKSSLFKRGVWLLRFLLRRKTSLLYRLTRYVENPPLQSLTNEKGDDNAIGRLFKTLVNGG